MSRNTYPYGKTFNLFPTNIKDFSESERERLLQQVIIEEQSNDNKDENSELLLSEERTSVVHLLGINSEGKKIPLVAISLDKYPESARFFLQDSSILNFFDLGWWLLRYLPDIAELPSIVDFFSENSPIEMLVGQQLFAYPKDLGMSIPAEKKKQVPITLFNVTGTHEKIKISGKTIINQDKLPKTKSNGVWFLFREKD